MVQSFTLITANLLHDRGDAASFEDMIETLSPDIVVTQELGTECADVLSDHYPYHHLQPAHDFTGRGIASRLPAEFGDIVMPARNATWAVVAVDSLAIRLVGMHLVNPIEFPQWRSARRRRKQLEALFEWTDSADDDVPLIVAGDMNASPSWPAYRMMSERWSDLVVEANRALGRAPEPTWGWRPGWPRMLRIDHVFGLGVRSTGARVEPISGSDHHAVIVDVEIEGQ
jgi:endonuclease/exonuclease/phosphatase family metal-dependent hydrolase